MSERRLKYVESVSDGRSSFYDCEGCSWSGVTVSNGNIEVAREAFAAHDCEDHIQPYSVDWFLYPRRRKKE